MSEVSTTERSSAPTVTTTPLVHRRAYRISDLVLRASVTLLLIAGAILFLVPLLWMLSTSLKTDTKIFAYPPQWLPQPIVLSQYLRVFQDTPVLLWARNTILITATTVIGATLSSSLVAYGFARLHARGSKILFYVMLSTMMLPGIVILIPQFLLFSYINWINTFYPLIVPTFFGIPFYIFLLRQFFLSLPRELDDAARIDGVGYIGTWWRILLPLSIAAHATVATFQFIDAWNDFLGPYVYLTSPNMMTLSLGTQYFLGLHGAEWGQLMAMSMLMLIPMIIAFAVGQRYFVRGISTTGFGGR